jgi:hypothetical protein
MMTAAQNGPELKGSTHEAKSRTISPEEVKGWFRNSVKGRMVEGQCAEIADRLTSLRWPCDPSVSCEEDYDFLPPLDRWWNFRATVIARCTLSEFAQFLLQSSATQIPRPLP